MYCINVRWQCYQDTTNLSSTLNIWLLIKSRLKHAASLFMSIFYGFIFVFSFCFFFCFFIAMQLLLILQSATRLAVECLFVVLHSNKFCINNFLINSICLYILCNERTNGYSSSTNFVCRIERISIVILSEANKFLLLNVDVFE